jgi:hypothetical protein
MCTLPDLPSFNWRRSAISSAKIWSKIGGRVMGRGCGPTAAML